MQHDTNQYALWIECPLVFLDVIANIYFFTSWGINSSISSSDCIGIRMSIMVSAILQSCVFISTCRYITRAVLIPFADVNEMTSTERMDADKSLRLAMKKAGRAAAVMVALGKELLSPESGEYLKVIVQKVETVVKGHRMVLSYSWLLLATFQVIISDQHLPVTNTHFFVYTQLIPNYSSGPHCCWKANT